MSAEYLRSFLDPKLFDAKCDRVIANIRKMRQKIPFDCITFTGLSGYLIAPVVCREMNVAMLPIRKSGAKTHSEAKIEQYPDREYKRAIILDDFIEYGDTVRRIIMILRKEMPYTKVVGLAMHRKWDIDNWDTMPSTHFVERIKPSITLPKWYV